MASVYIQYVERKQKDNLQFNSAFTGKEPVSWHSKNLKIFLSSKHNFSTVVHKLQYTDLNNWQPPYEWNSSFNPNVWNMDYNTSISALKTA